jgi:hypothetical protein
MAIDIEILPEIVRGHWLEKVTLFPLILISPSAITHNILQNLANLHIICYIAVSPQKTVTEAGKLSFLSTNDK